MLEKIVVFMPPYSQYGVLHYFTRELTEALVRLGIECKIVEPEPGNPSSVLKDILLFSPDCTLSFNGFLPDANGSFFCDLIQVPHVACLVDSPNHFFSLVNSPYTIVTCVDRFFCHFFQETKETKSIFMPHGVSKNVYASPTDKREYDCAMLATCIDPEVVRRGWKRFSPALTKVLENAAEKTLSDQRTSCIEAFTEELNHSIEKLGADIDASTLNFEELFDELEMFVTGADRLELLLALKGHVQVHVFGAGLGGAQWSSYFPEGQQDVIVHEPIPHEEALQVMKKSRVVLNSCPKIKQGAHERIFSGIACGAAVLTNDNSYVREIFSPNQSIMLYQHKRWDEAAATLQTYLKDENKRIEMVNKGYEVVKNGHTWDHRAKMLSDALPATLKNLQDAYG